jgi:hypothetical protein
MKLTNLTLEIHFVLFLLIVIGALAVGFFIGRLLVARLRERILEVEDEMLHSNNEVLRYVEINKQLTEALEKAKIPLPKVGGTDEDEKVRKIPLGKIG